MLDTLSLTLETKTAFLGKTKTLKLYKKWHLNEENEETKPNTEFSGKFQNTKCRAWSAEKGEMSWLQGPRLLSDGGLRSCGCHRCHFSVPRARWQL